MDLDTLLEILKLVTGPFGSVVILLAVLSLIFYYGRNFIAKSNSSSEAFVSSVQNLQTYLEKMDTRMERFSDAVSNLSTTVSELRQFIERVEAVSDTRLDNLEKRVDRIEDRVENHLK